MNQREWTPGPWTAVKAGTFWDVCDQNNRDVVTVYGGGVGPEYKTANARLISAAPDLYEALEDMLHRCPGQITQQALDALAKARGET